MNQNTVDMTLPSSAIVMILLSAFLCLPPFMALRLVARFYRRARRHNLNGGRFLIALAVLLVAFLFNLGVIYGAAGAMQSGGLTIGRVQAVALGISWVAFWFWIFMAFGIGQPVGRGGRPH